MTGRLDRARPPRVIAGVDGSPHSAAALAWAAADAQLRDWELVVVTCCGRDALPAGPGVRPATVADCVQAGHEMQARLLHDLHAPAALSVSTLVLRGDPVTALTGTAAPGDVLVVGTRGRGRVRALLLGSVAQGCAGHAVCPVVVVPLPHEAARPAAAGGAVVAGVDASREARAALRFAAGEAALRGAALLPVHAVYPDYTTTQTDSDGGMAGNDDLLPPLESAWAQLDLLVRTELSGLEVAAQPVTVCGAPDEVLLRWTQSAALTVVGGRGVGRLHTAMLGSVSSSLLRHGHCPIAVVPASAAGS